MPYLRWIETTFRQASETDQAKELIIPVLVLEGSQQSHHRHIIGFDVIENILKNTEKTEQYHTVKKAFPSLKRKKVRDFIQAVSAEQEDKFVVKTKKGQVTVTKNTLAFKLTIV